MELAISEITLRDRHRKDLGDIDGLAESIKSLGLLHPVVVLPDKTLVVGERRLEAYRKLGRDVIPVNIVESLSDAMRFIEAERDENICRKDFTPEEAVTLAEALLEIEKPKAQKRKSDGNKAGGKKGGKSRPAENSSTGISRKPKIRDESNHAKNIAARSVGMDRRTLEKATEVVNAAKSEPEKYGHLVEKMNATGKVGGVHRQLKVARQAEAIAAEPPPLPTGPFRVLVVDPPWKYDNRPDDPSHRGSNPYPSMSIEEIKAMPLGGIAEADSVLWLWTTNGHQRYAYEIAEAWGFQHKATLTWVKPKIGLGDYLRNRTEHCLLCVKGKPTLTLSAQSTVLMAAAAKHSQKPAAFYELVESLCPGSKAEIFSRKNRKGWFTYGDEAGSL